MRKIRVRFGEISRWVTVLEQDELRLTVRLTHGKWDFHSPLPTQMVHDGEIYEIIGTDGSLFRCRLTGEPHELASDL